MIRAHRVSATAQDDASLVSGWNIAPNVSYVLRLTPSAGSCGVFLYDESNVLVASGAVLSGTDQPCALIPQTGQSVGMVDGDLGWHLLISADGTETMREIRINPSVDLPDEIHPIYVDDDMALARATAAIDAAAHYPEDVAVSCPLGFGAGIGDIVSAPVDAAPVVGQGESITWTGAPGGASEQVVIRRYVAIAPEPSIAPPAPPAVADDAGATDAATTTSGNVLTNDESGLTVVAVNGLSGNVGVAVAGNNGGLFTIASNGTWTFDPAGEFTHLVGTESATTSVAYHASDGVGEAMGILTVTVSSAASSGDPYWPSVELYVPMTGANNGTTFTDLAKGWTITRNAPLITQTGTGPQNETSYGYCASATDFAAPQLLVPHHSSLNLGAKDFCVDFFYRPTTLGANKNHPRFFDKRGSTNNYEIVFVFYNGVLFAYVSSNGTSLTELFANLPWSPILNQWYHLRLSRSGPTWRLWINGQKFWQGTWSGSIFAGTAPFMIMGDGVNVARGTWSMCHFRLTVGHARETTDVIDVPLLPYPTE